MGKAKIDKKKLKAPIDKAFRRTMFLLGRSFTEAISDPNAFDGFPSQDLVDTGRLRASQRLIFPGEGKARFSWNTDYAIYLHQGYTLRNGKRQPGRPWTREGLKRSKVDETFKDQIRKELGS